MAFVARFSRREAGGYDCAYGKGAKQLTAVMEQIDGKWKITSGFGMETVPDKKCGVVKEGWGKLAEVSYGAALSVPTEVATTPARPGPPSLRKLALGAGSPETPALPAPRIKGASPLDLTIPRNAMAPFSTPDIAPEGAATCPHCNMPFNGWSWQKAPEDSRDHRRVVPPCRCNMPNPEDYTPGADDFRMYRRGPSGQFDILTKTGALDIVYHWMLRNKEYVTTNGVLDAPWSHVQDALWRDTGYAEYRPEVWQ